MLINRRPILGKDRSRFLCAKRPRKINYIQLRKEVVATSEMLIILRSSDFMKKAKQEVSTEAAVH